MRVIRTELFYQAEELKIPKDIDHELSVSVAWNGVSSWPNNVTDILNELIAEGIIQQTFEIDEYKRFLDDTIRGASYRPKKSRVAFPPSILSDPTTVHQILNEPIVIEQSPPIIEPFSGLLAKATPIAGGLYVGIHMASGDLVMMITVPLGILLVGTAVAVTKAIEAGLMRAVAGKGMPSPRRRKRSKGGSAASLRAKR